MCRVAQTWQAATLLQLNICTFQLWKNAKCLTALCVSSGSSDFEGIYLVDYLIMDWWEEDLLELEWYLLTNKKKEQHLNKSVCNYHVISKKYPNRDLWHNNIRREWQISLSVLSANKMYCYVLCHKNTHNSDHCCLVCWLVWLCPVCLEWGRFVGAWRPPAPLFTGSIDHTSYCIIALYWQPRQG